MKTIILIAFSLLITSCTKPVKPNEEDILIGECICKKLGGLREISKTVYPLVGNKVYSITMYCLKGGVEYYENRYYEGCEK